MIRGFLQNSMIALLHGDVKYADVKSTQLSATPYTSLSWWLYSAAPSQIGKNAHYPGRLAAWQPVLCTEGPAYPRLRQTVSYPRSVPESRLLGQLSPCKAYTPCIFFNNTMLVVIIMYYQYNLVFESFRVREASRQPQHQGIKLYDSN